MNNIFEIERKGINKSVETMNIVGDFDEKTTTKFIYLIEITRTWVDTNGKDQYERFLKVGFTKDINQRENSWPDKEFTIRVIFVAACHGTITRHCIKDFINNEGEPDAEAYLETRDIYSLVEAKFNRHYSKIRGFTIDEEDVDEDGVPIKRYGTLKYSYTPKLYNGKPISGSKECYKLEHHDELLKNLKRMLMLSTNSNLVTNRPYMSVESNSTRDQEQGEMIDFCDSISKRLRQIQGVEV